MELLFNELSLHGQFHDIASFKNAIKQLMQLRVCARKFGREVYCQRYGLQNLQITRTEKLQQILSLLNRDQKIAITSWMDRNGPFLEDIRQHSEDDYLSYNDIIVTNNAIGEAAWCMLHDIDRKLVSLAPSNWLITPISITWINDSNITQIANVENYWEVDTLQSMLTLIEPPIRSWIQLEDRVRRRYDSLFFADNAFEPIRAYPFVSHVAERVLFICNILNRFKNCFSYDGKRTPEGNKIYQDFFTGKKGGGGRGALFSDSSDEEKNEFKNALTFNHPQKPHVKIFCPWHGKVQTPKYRIHFSWPVRVNEPLYVVYIGEKLTKR